jgi:uncharacterized protein
VVPVQGVGGVGEGAGVHRPLVPFPHKKFFKTVEQSILLLLAVFVASLILTMIGLGGGLIFSPLFVLLAFPQAEAASASLFLNGIGAGSAALVYIRKKMVDFGVSLPLIVTSSLGAPLGALTTHWINQTAFLWVMAAVVLLAGLRMLSGTALEASGPAVSRVRLVAGGGAVGLAIGFLGGLLGIGGGVFVVPLLIYLLQVPTKTAAASSIFIVCFSSLTGFLTHASLGAVNWPFVLLAGLFSSAGGFLGSRLMVERIQARTIRLIFGIVLLALSARLVLQALR